MERLTERRFFKHYRPEEETATVCINGYIQITEPMYENYKDFRAWLIGKAVDKLAYYEDLEENGLLLKLPCNVGDAVYCIVENSKGYIIMMDIVEGIHIHKYSRSNLRMKEADCIELAGLGRVRLELFGVLIFHTIEAAEKALKEMQKQGAT